MNGLRSSAFALRTDMFPLKSGVIFAIIMLDAAFALLFMKLNI